LRYGRMVIFPIAMHNPRWFLFASLPLAQLSGSAGVSPLPVYALAGWRRAEKTFQRLMCLGVPGTRRALSTGFKELPLSAVFELTCTADAGTANREK